MSALAGGPEPCREGERDRPADEEVKMARSLTLFLLLPPPVPPPSSSQKSFSGRNSSTQSRPEKVFFETVSTPLPVSQKLPKELGSREERERARRDRASSFTSSLFKFLFLLSPLGVMVPGG